MATASFYKGSDEIPSAKCETCSSNNKVTDAISYCTVCTEYLCQSCDMAHGTFRQTKAHTVLKGKDMPSMTAKPNLPYLFCETHNSTSLSLYCKTHDMVICPACKVVNHTQCKTVDIRTHCSGNEFTKELSQVSKDLAHLKVKYERLIKNRNTDRSTLNTQLQQCLFDIKQFRKEINEKLDHLEKELSSEIKCIEKSLRQEIDGHVTLADDIIRKMTDMEKSLSDCQKSRENEAMFIASKKTSSHVKDYEGVINHIQTDLYAIDYRFRPCGVLADMVQQLNSVGEVTNNSLPVKTSQPSVLNLSVHDREDINVKSEWVCDCSFMPNGDLVLGCGNDGIKLFDNNFQFKAQLSILAVRVSTISDTEVMVTQGNLKKVAYVKVHADKLVLKTQKELDRKCYGLDVRVGEVYVTCHDSPGRGEVIVLNMDGDIKRRLGVDRGQYIFECPNFVKVNGDGSKIFVSDEKTNIVTCLDSQGHVIYKYSDIELKSPAGLYVDGDDNMLVCGLNSNNVHVVGHDGRKHNVLLSEKDGVEYPQCVTYRQSDGCLVVGVHEEAKTDKKLLIFKTR